MSGSGFLQLDSIGSDHGIGLGTDSCPALPCRQQLTPFEGSYGDRARTFAPICGPLDARRSLRTATAAPVMQVLKVGLDKLNSWKAKLGGVIGSVSALMYDPHPSRHLPTGAPIPRSAPTHSLSATAHFGRAARVAVRRWKEGRC